MATNFKSVAIISFIGLAAVYATCQKRIDCSQTDYSFDGSFKIYYDSDSIKVGDTIFLEFTHPIVFYDSVRNITVNYNGAENFGAVISFTEFVGNQEVGAVANFILKLDYGRLSSQIINPEQNQEYLFDENNSEYKFKLSITPKKKGKYVITLHNAANVYTKSDKCSKASFQFKFKETNQHFYLLNQWRPDLVLQEPGKSRVYYFKVI